MTVTQVGDLSNLNELYALSEDPWHSRSGWAASRKRAVLLSALPRARHSKSLEIGCDAGELTFELARRSDLVVGADFRRPRVEAARRRTDHLSNVEIELFKDPEDCPSAVGFDLIVLHEIGYSFEASSWAHVCHRVAAGVALGATVLACHTRDEVDGRLLETETVHGMLESILGLPKQTHIADTDFVIDVWTKTDETPSRSDGLR